MKKPLSVTRLRLLQLASILYSIKYGWRLTLDKPNPLADAPFWYLRYVRFLKNHSDPMLSADGWLIEREYKKQRQLRIKQ